MLITCWTNHSTTSRSELAGADTTGAHQHIPNCINEYEKKSFERQLLSKTVVSTKSSSLCLCCPPLKGTPPTEAPPTILLLGMHPRSSSSHDSVETEGSGSAYGDPGGLVQRVTGLMVFGGRSSSVLPFQEAKDARSFCSKVDDSFVTSRSLRRSSNFGSRWMVVLLLLSGLIHLSNAAEECNILKSFDRNDLMTCTGPRIDITDPNHPKKYLLADFSSFSQKDLDQVFTVRPATANTTKQFTGLFMLKNSKITAIKFDFVAKKNSFEQSFTLMNNLDLVNVTISPGKLELKTARILFKVTGNKRLSKESIENLKKIEFLAKGSYIQDFGECILDPKVVDLSVLDGCSYVKGDLQIGAHTKNDTKITKNILTNVTGSLEVKGSKFTNIDFMTKITDVGKSIEIMDNKDLCLHPKDLKMLKKRLPAVKYENNKDCKGECTSQYFINEKDMSCAIINGSITISGVSDSDNLAHFSAVEIIIGQLVITNTKLKKIDMFPNLHTVDFSQSTENDHPAIFVWGNVELTHFSLPKLTEVKLMNGAVAAGIALEDNNKAFYMEEEDLWKYGNITKTRLPKKTPPPILNEIKNNQTSDTGNETSRRTGTEHKEGFAPLETSLIVVGSIVGVVFLVVVVILAIVLPIVCVRKRRKQRNIQREKEIRKELDSRLFIDSSKSTSKSAFAGCGTNTKPMENTDNSETTIDPWDNSISHHMSDFQLAMNDFTITKLREEYNLECTQLTKKVEIQINRDHVNTLDFEASLKLEEEKMEANVEKIYTHNMGLRLFTIRPRKENTKLLKYQQSNTFDPMMFMEVVMSSSAVELSPRTMHDALDYVMDHPFGAHSKENPKECQLIMVDGPVHIIGDTHGSLIDLQALLSIQVPNAPCKIGETEVHPMFRYKYLFLGDYCDRGIYDIVCLVFLAVLAKFRKDKVFLLRGNHDWIHHQDPQHRSSHFDHMEKLYGPEEGDRTKQGSIGWKFDRLRDKLPFCAIVERKIFACHGGVSEDFMKILNKWALAHDGDFVHCFKYLPIPLFACPEEKPETFEEYGILNTEEKFSDAVALLQGLTWPDPGHFPYHISSRNCGGLFNKETLRKVFEFFDDKKPLQVLVRAHQDIGFSWEHGGKTITVFGNFHTGFSTVGFPYLLSNEHFLSAMEPRVSIGMLRVEANGTLTMLMLRHHYEANELTLDEGEPKWKGNFELAKKKSREKAKKKTDDEPKAQRKGKSSYGNNSKKDEKTEAPKSKVDAPKSAAEAVQSKVESNVKAPQSKADSKSGPVPRTKPSALPSKNAPPSGETGKKSSKETPNDEAPQTKATAEPKSGAAVMRTKQSVAPSKNAPLSAKKSSQETPNTKAPQAKADSKSGLTPRAKASAAPSKNVQPSGECVKKSSKETPRTKPSADSKKSGLAPRTKKSVGPSVNAPPRGENAKKSSKETPNEKKKKP